MGHLPQLKSVNEYYWTALGRLQTLDPLILSHLGPLAEGFLCSCPVGYLALPCCKCRGLECTAIREGQLPRAVESHLVDGIQVD